MIKKAQRQKAKPLAYTKTTNKSKMLAAKLKKAQEEMVGFGLIIVIVAVILLIFLWFFLVKPGKQNIEDYETESFVQAALQYTTECETRYGNLEVQELIFECYEERKCLSGQDSCVVLNSTLKGILEQSWKIREDSNIKAYNLQISVRDQEISLFQQGNTTLNSKGYVQELPKTTKVSFLVYY